METSQITTKIDEYIYYVETQEHDKDTPRQDFKHPKIKTPVGTNPQENQGRTLIPSHVTQPGDSLVTRGKPVGRFMVGLSIPVTPVSQYMEGQCCCCRKAEQWQLACKFCECCEYSRTSLRHVLCWCCDSPDSPTFAKPCCADSPTFAKPCCADSPDSVKVSLASVMQIWQVWWVWRIWRV